MMEPPHICYRNDMMAKYGMTSLEIDKSNFSSVYKYINQNEYDSMDVILAEKLFKGYQIT